MLLEESDLVPIKADKKPAARNKDDNSSDQEGFSDMEKSNEEECPDEFDYGSEYGEEEMEEDQDEEEASDSESSIEDDIYSGEEIDYQAPSDSSDEKPESEEEESEEIEE